MNPAALITGISGQDGSYLAELLLGKGYEVHGLTRASTVGPPGVTIRLPTNLTPHPNLFLHQGDLLDGNGLSKLLAELNPSEIYNLAAQSNVKQSFDQPEFTAEVVGLGVLRLLEAVRNWQSFSGRKVRIYQAGSSEMFGNARPRQHENTPFLPRSPYAIAKVFAHSQCVNYRDGYGLFISNGILFNHESPRRPETFLTRKITRAAARIKLGLQGKLVLGNLDARRDWGFAGDYVEAMWRMLQHEEPGDFVVATGHAISIRDFLCLVFGQLDLDWEEFVTIDPLFFRPTDLEHMEGDSTKARQILGWKPKFDVKALASLMLDADLCLAERENPLTHRSDHL